jgi:hypothetical protein
MNLPARQRLSIGFSESPRSQPVRICHKPARFSKLVAKLMKLQSRPPPSAPPGNERQ